MQKNSKTEDGRIFEKYISSIYEALNFAVTTNRSIFGQQVDIYAEKIIPGIGNTKLIIECKYKEKGSVSNQQVYDFISYFKSIKEKDNSFKGIMVTNTGFSKDAKLAADSIITLLTSEQLESEIFDIKDPYLNLKQSFEKKEIFEEFIPLYGKTDKENKKIDLIEKITNYSYHEWKRITFISILADYGSGKTTLLQRLNYLFSKNYLEGKSKIKPIYLELKHFQLHKDLNTFLVNSFIKLFQREIPIETINEKINHGNFIFLLDGFDEMSPQVNTNVRLENFLKLSPLLLSNSCSIMTCRPSYFVSKQEFEQAIETIIEINSPSSLEINKASNFDLVTRKQKNENIYQKLISKYTDNIHIKKESSKIGSLPIVINLLELEKEQIDMFLKKFDNQFDTLCKSSWKDVKDFLEEIYDISDLLKKPILLSMIKDTILELGVNYKLKNKVYDPVSLYETYTKANLHRDWSKGETRQLLSNNQRDKFAEAIAMFMFETDILTINYESLLEFIKENNELLKDINFFNKLSIEEIASDIQVCSFIQRNDDNQFKFIHKSFMEFYVARHLKRSLFKEKTLINKKPIQKEILIFIGCYTFTDYALKDNILKIIGKNSTLNPIFKRNIFLALILSNNKIQNIYAKKIDVNLILLNKINFYKCTFEDILFVDSNINDVKIDSCNFIILSNNTSFERIKFYNSYISVNLKNTELNEIDILNCQKINISNAFTIGNIRTSSSIITVNSENYNIFKFGFFYNSTLNINSKKITFQNITLKRSSLLLNSLEVFFSKCLLKNTTLDNSPINKENTITFIENSVAKNTIINLNKEHNSMFINDSLFIETHFNEIKVYPDLSNTIEKNRFINCTGKIYLMNFNKNSKFSVRDKYNETIRFTYNENESIKLDNLEIIALNKNPDRSNTHNS